MAIKPIDLPSAAGINRGEGDVRHFAEGDSMSVPALAGPTRELAERDNKLAEKINETIAVVNNKEQFVPLPVLRTTLSPNDEIVVTNYRIPAGFEARVLNAAISSSPLSADIELNIYYAQGFGNTTGSVLVTTSDENTSGTSFKQDGEFIIALKNKGGITLDVVASILLTMRPIGAVGTLLVGSVIQGDPGPPGMTGPQGIQGPPGTGGAGSPGMVWTGAWVSGRSYNTKEVASFTLYGTVISSYICLVAHTSNSANAPDADPAIWDPVAIGSSGSVQGIQGATGAQGAGAFFSTQQLSGTITTGVDYQSGSFSSDYNSTLPSSGVGPFLCRESAVFSTVSGTQGMAFINGKLQTCFKGHGTITFPQQSSGAKANYSTSYVNMYVTSNGTSPVTVDPVAGTFATLAEVSALPSGLGYVVNVRAATPIPLTVFAFGMQPF
jgi:hypothetical protein